MTAVLRRISNVKMLTLLNESTARLSTCISMQKTAQQRLETYSDLYLQNERRIRSIFMIIAPCSNNSDVFSKDITILTTVTILPRRDHRVPNSTSLHSTCSCHPVAEGDTSRAIVFRYLKTLRSIVS